MRWSPTSRVGPSGAADPGNLPKGERVIDLRFRTCLLQGDPTILKEISPECSLEGMMLKLKLQYFGHLMRRVDSLEKTLMLGGIAGRRRKGRQRIRWLDGINDLIDVESE